MKSSRLWQPVLALPALIVSAPYAPAQTAADSWSPSVPLMEEGSTNYLAAIHATLLPDGTVMVIGFSQNDLAPASICGRNGSMTAIFDPNSGTGGGAYHATRYVEAVEFSSASYCPGEGACGPANCAHDAYFCSGHTLLADGRLFVAGGLRTVNASNPNPFYQAGGGIDYGALWNWLSPGWTRIMAEFTGQPVSPYLRTPYFEGTERYYPTATRYIDGRVLIISGSQILGATAYGEIPASGPITNLSAEFYNPGPATYTALLAAPPPEVFNSDYTHSFVLPKKVQGYDLIMVGEDSAPVFLNVSMTPEAWSAPQSARPGPPVATPNEGASSLMLPIRVTNGQFGYANGSLLVAGGEPNSQGSPPGPGHYADLYDVATGFGSWDSSERIELVTDRHHPATILLPNGEVAVIGGHVPGQSGTGIQLKAEYINFRGANYTVTPGNPSPGTVSRGYHTAAVLLPDGRVLVAGGRIGGSISAPIESATVQFLSPPYMSLTRPVILSAPSVITAGGDLSYPIHVAGGFSEVVLVGLGSMTHSVDMNQRHVQLRVISITPVEPTDGIPAYQGTFFPPTQRQAPPGYYMLFVLSAGVQKVPSVASIVHVQ